MPLVNGKPASRVVHAGEGDDARVVYLSAVPMAEQPCSVCHGANVDPALKAVIDSAYTMVAEIGYTFDHRAKPRLSLFGDIASGDDPASASFNRFDTLFGIRRGEWGPSSSLYGPLSRNNIRDFGLRFEIKPSKRVDAFLAARAAWLDEPTDSFAKTGIRDATGQSGRQAGEQIEARVRYWVVPDFIQLDVGGAVLAKGEFLRSAPNVSNTGDTRYFYADLYFKF